MTSYTRVVERGLRLVVALALMFGVIPIDAAAAQPMAETAGASLIRSVGATPVATDRVEALREARAYPAALDQSLNSAPQNSAPQAPDAVSLTATKRDALATDVNSNGKADPGDTLEYTVVITDNGTTDATGLNFTDTLDANTTLVGGSLSASPVAVNDTYPQTVIGNVSINSALIPFSITSNDYMGVNPAATITAYDAISANGGTVVVNTDGTFTYDPPRGFEGTDTFTYTISNSTGSNTATVSIPVSGMVWFINNNAGACSSNCDGRLSHPYTTLAAFNTANALSGGVNPDNNDNIFIYESATAYSGGVTLRSGQKLIGQDATASLSFITGLTPPTSSTSFPAMNSANGTFTNLVNTVTLNTNTTVRGLQINSTTSTGMTDPVAAITGVSVSDISITTTTGTAVALSNTGGTLSFNSISSNGAANGILLVNTTGSFTVNGSGSAGSGGTIKNSVGSDAAGIIPTASENAGSGIFLYNAQNVSLNWMQLNDHQNFAIYGNTVNDFTLANSVVNGTNGTNAVVDEASIAFNGLTGVASVSNTSISGGIEDNFRVRNTSGSLNRITFNTVTIGANSTATGNAGILLDASGSATLNATVQSSNFTASRADLFHLNAVGSAVSDLVFHNNALSDNQPGIATGGGGMTVGAGDNTGSVNLTFNIDSNTFRDADGHAILIFKSTDPGTVQGTFSNNTIGVVSVANSGSVNGDGIKIQNAGLGTVTVNVLNNHIYQYNNFGVELLTGGGASAMSGTFNATVTGNTISNPGTGGLPMNGIHLNGGTVPGDTYAICTDVGGAGGLANAITSSGANGGTDVRLRQRQATTVRLPGYGGANNDNAAVQTYLTGRNSTAPTALASNTVPTGGGFVGGAACTQPVAMLAPNRELAKSDRGVNDLVMTQTRSLNFVTTSYRDGSKPLFSLRFDPALRPSGAPQTDRAVAINRVNDAIAPVTVGTLPAGKSVIIKFRAAINNLVPDGVTQVSNQGTITADGGISALTDDPDTVAPNDPTVTPLNIVADIQLLSKNDGGITATPGQQFGYTLVYTNAGPQGAAGVVLTETVPANTTYTGSGWTCTPDGNAGSTCTNNVGIVSRNTGGSAVFTVTVINPVPAAMTQISNTASIGTSVNDPVPGNNTASDTTPIDAAPDLALTKSDGGASVAPGGTVAYTLNYTNAGNQGATGVVLTETVPANTSFNAGASSAGWTCSPDNNAGSTCGLTVGGVNGGGASGSRTFAVTVVNPIAAGVTQISNTASVADDGSNGVDTNPANNTASDTTPVNAAPDLTLTKSDGGVTTTPGGIVIYTLTYTNTGNQGATGVVLTDAVPANTSFNAGSSSAGWSCIPDNSAGSVCTLTIGALNGGGASGSRAFAVTVVNPVAAGVTQISNTAAVGDDGSNGADPTPGNNTASDTTPVTAAPDLQLSKSDGEARGVPNGTVAYTLAFTNTGNQGAAGVTLTDTVPANTTFNSSASSVGWSCANGALSGTVCSLVVGGVVGGGVGSRLFAVTVDSPFPSTESSITNTASIADDGTNGVDATPANNIASDSTPIDTVPDVAITKTHTGNFTKGQVGATYTLHVSNVGGLPTTDVVTVTDILPIGLTATALSGTGWACDLGTLTCTRSDVLGPFASYPDITLTVDVAVNTSSTVTNTATVSGGGESNTANDTANDVTSINKAASTTTLISGPNPSVFGQSVTFTATVTSGVGTPTGIVTFTEGAVTLGTGTLSGGVATFSTSILIVGSHSITATYGGDSNFNTSVVTATQTVNKANSTTTLTSAPNPSVFGQSVTFTATVSASAPGAGTPTGVVTFTEGATTLATSTLSGGVATFSTSALTVGSHNVTATYSGDGSFNASNTTTTQIVNAANSATTLTSAPNPSVFGQSVTFTATVIATAPGAGTPTGSVTFFDSGASIGTGALLSGVATFSTASLSVGTHPITATYTGNVNFNASVSNQIDQVVDQANTSTALASHPNPSVFGQAVVFTATVTANTPGSGTPTGNVTFFDNGASIGSGVLSGGVATFSTTSLAVGTHPITATYNGDTSFTVSTSSSLSQVINRASTSTALASNPNPSVFGQSVTFTATVTANAPGSGTPTGNVTFFDNGTSIGTGTLSGGIATFSTSSLAVGSHPIVATYTGDTGFNSSSATTLNQVVNRADTTTVIVSDPNPSLPGQTVFFTATVGAVAPGTGTPTGNVTFYDNGASIGTGALSGGIATLNTASLTIGTHPITATYAGNASFNASTAAIYTQTVSKADTGTTLASSPNPTVFGQPVTFTATVTATFGTATGSVTFFDNGASIGTGTLSGGIATLSTASLSVGTHPITATYAGNANFNGSLSNQIDQVVDQANTSTALVSHPNPSVFGQTVTFTATVTAVAPGAGTPTGTVTFFDNGASIGTGTLSGGVATLNISTLSVGTHPITATYAGSASFNGSGSNQIDQVVNQANTSTALASNPNPSVFGQAVTFTATVAASAPGSGIPTGSVTFFDGGTSIGSGVLSGGIATLNTASLSVGTHPITATYSGDTSFNGSTASVLSQVVDRAGTNTILVSAPNPSIFGQSVTFTATVSASAPGAGTPTGVVTFTADATTYTQTLTSGVATFSTSGLAVGNHSVTAHYSGDGNFNASSSSALNQVVDKANSATLLISAPNPSIRGQSVTFTATVSASAPGAGLPTGNVTFVENAVTLGSGTLDASGVVTLSTASLSVGAHPITATYAGDVNFNGSNTSVTHTVDRATSAMTLTSAPNPSVFGQAVTFTATVAVVAPGAGTPTGVVTFTEGTTMLGAANLNGNRVATISTAALSVGSHNVTATYSGDGNFVASTSPTFVQVVNKAGTATSISSATSPVFAGQPATVTFTVAAVAPGVGVPTGVITATDGSISCTATLPVTSCTVVFATPGSKNITAVYGGDDHFLGSVSSPATLINVVEVPIAGLSAANSSPNWLGSATAFTASITSGTNVAYQWNFGDGHTGGGITTTHTYAAVGTYTATVTATNSAGSLMAQTVAVIKSSKLYLPWVARNFVDAPDLIVTNLIASTGQAQVVIKNQGPAPVVNGFYVDLYVNPNPVPTKVNQIWYDGRSQQGVVWGVTAPLQPGQVMTLTIGDAYYLPDYSVFTGTLPIGTPLYAQVDSYNPFTTYGAVLENHEINGSTYNNILGPVLSTANSTLPAKVTVPLRVGSKTTLPIRLR